MIIESLLGLQIWKARCSQEVIDIDLRMQFQPDNLYVHT